VLKISHSARAISSGRHPIAAFCVHPNKSPLGRSRSISSVNGNRPTGPTARDTTS
jgi:hypothetical protein